MMKIDMTIDEMARNVAEKALDKYVFQGRTLRELAKLIASGDIIEIGKIYASGDYKIITEDHKGYQTFRIVKRRG